MRYFVSMFDKDINTWVTICTSYRYSYIFRFFNEMRNSFPNIDFKLCEVLDNA